jgi:hypothetical protein
MKKLLVFLFSLCISIFSFSQTRQVKGNVTDETGVPLSGATVLLSGSKTGTQTDAKGNFSLSTGGTGAVKLVISYTGYKSVIVNADEKTSVITKTRKGSS